MKETINGNDFPDEKLANYAMLKDSLGCSNELAPLIKRVYYPDLNLTFEYRRAYESHKRYEIIICYDSINYMAIPFYWQHLDGQLKLYLFESKMNSAIHAFFNNDSLRKSYGLALFQEMFTKRLMENMSVYKVNRLSFKEIDALIYSTQKAINSNKYESKECRDHAVENLKKIQPEMNISIYNFPYNNVQLLIRYTDKGVEIEEINTDCFFDLVW